MSADSEARTRGRLRRWLTLAGVFLLGVLVGGCAVIVSRAATDRDKAETAAAFSAHADYAASYSAWRTDFISGVHALTAATQQDWEGYYSGDSASVAKLTRGIDALASCSRTFTTAVESATTVTPQTQRISTLTRDACAKYEQAAAAYRTGLGPPGGEPLEAALLRGDELVLQADRIMSVELVAEVQRITGQ